MPRQASLERKLQQERDKQSAKQAQQDHQINKRFGLHDAHFPEDVGMLKQSQPENILPDTGLPIQQSKDQRQYVKYPNQSDISHDIGETGKLIDFYLDIYYSAIPYF
jgi:hypothetical protein